MTRKEFARQLRKGFRRQHGYLNPLPEDADERFDVVETRLGFVFPLIVRFLFRHAGEDFIDPEWSAEQYLKWRIVSGWPERLVPLAEEGCGIWLCLDCSQESAPVVKWRGDYLAEESDDLIFEHEASSFVDWLRSQFSLGESDSSSS